MACVNAVWSLFGFACEQLENVKESLAIWKGIKRARLKIIADMGDNKARTPIVPKERTGCLMK